MSDATAEADARSLDDYSRDELEDLVRDLADEVTDLKADLAEQRSNVDDLTGLVEAYSRQMQKMKQVIAGDGDAFFALEGYGEGHNIVHQLEMVDAKLDGFAERLQKVPEKPSEQQDTEGRLWAIRKYLVEQAYTRDQNIYAADYREVGAIFSDADNRGGISDSWASQLMRKAAGTFPGDIDEAKHGFEIVEKQPRNEIRVYADRIEDTSLL